MDVRRTACPDRHVDRLLDYLRTFRGAGCEPTLFEDALGIALGAVLARARGARFETAGRYFVVDLADLPGLASLTLFEGGAAVRPTDQVYRGGLIHLTLRVAGQPVLDLIKRRLEREEIAFLGVLPNIVFAGPGGLTAEVTIDDPDERTLPRSPARAQRKFEAWTAQQEEWVRTDPPSGLRL